MSDKEMVHSPNSWPQWPHLPFTRRKEPNIGFMFGDQPSNGPFKIYLGNMFDPERTNLKVLSYPTIEELLADGWRVD